VKISHQMTLEKTTIDACWKLLLTTWPEIDDLPDGVFNVIVNQIQRVLETEGLAAITPERIEGWKELTEEHLMPMNDLYQAQKNPSKATELSSATSQD
jgi:hypothetical protein